MFNGLFARLSLPAGLSVILWILSFFVTPAEAGEVRVKDICDFQDKQEVTLIGYGLVVGLDGSGDGTGTQFTTRSLANMMERMGLTIEPDKLKVKNIAAVIVSLGLGFGIAFMAMVQPEIFNRVRIMENAVPGADDVSPPRYEKLRLPASEEAHYVETLGRYMTEKKLYLQEDLTLQDLADELSISPHHLSMILNVHFRQNFYTFVNGYRVEEVKRMLADPANRDRSILSIAYDAGFNSKSTFNTIFRKFTGKTPRQYRAELPT